MISNGRAANEGYLLSRQDDARGPQTSIHHLRRAIETHGACAQAPYLRLEALQIHGTFLRAKLIPTDNGLDKPSP